MLAPSSGFDVNTQFSDISVNTSILSTFFYDGSITQLGINPGLLLTTGIEPGPFNSSDGFGAGNGQPGDPDLSAVVPGTLSHNATTITFTLNNNDPAVTGLRFNLVFGSEEFPEYVDDFPDIGAVYVNGVNYALFNGEADQPLSVLSSNLDAGNFIDNAEGDIPLEYDGISASLSIVAPLVQGENTIKIGVADLGDTILDSGMFIANLAAVTEGGGGGGGLYTDVTGTDDGETIPGSDNNENVAAGGGDDDVNGEGGDDILDGEGGNDDLNGGEGDDVIIGGDGTNDKALFTGNPADYDIVFNPQTGNVEVTDLREGSPDGHDIVTPSVEFLVFGDGSIIPMSNYLPEGNGDPVAVNDTGAAGENQTALFDILANDTDPDGDALTIAAATVTGTSGVALTPAQAQAAFSIQGGDLKFTPGTLFDPLNPGQTADVEVSYTVSDGYGGSDEGTFTLTVNGAAEPVAGPGNGTAGSDNLAGTDGKESFSGRAGDDAIDAGGGNDIVNGGAGNDQMNGGDGVDLLSFVGSTAPGVGVTVDLRNTGPQDTGGAGQDTIQGFENLEGTHFDDVLIGDGGVNKIRGLGGDDTIRGGGGNDDLTGGAGGDSFVFESTGANGFDRIRGFVTGEDQLVFAVSDGYAADASLTIGKQAVGAGAQFVFDGALDLLSYDADGAGGTGAVLLAGFATMAPEDLQAGDILIVPGPTPGGLLIA